MLGTDLKKLAVVNGRVRQGSLAAEYIGGRRRGGVWRLDRCSTAEQFTEASRQTAGGWLELVQKTWR